MLNLNVSLSACWTMVMKNADPNNMEGVHAYLQQKKECIAFPVTLSFVSEDCYPRCLSTFSTVQADYSVTEVKKGRFIIIINYFCLAYSTLMPSTDTCKSIPKCIQFNL